MKIGILTLPLKYNYGGILQAYALQTILERMGHKVSVITITQQKEMPSHAILRYAKRVLLKILHHGRGDVFVEKKHNEEFPVLTANTWRFVKKYIHLNTVNSYSCVSPSEYDCIVVGSDQVWRSGYTQNDRDFFLEFAKDWPIKRVVYAASFGLNKWTLSEKDTPICRKLAQLFDAISVREEDGVKLCKDNLGIDAVHVLDPTLLLDVKDYELIINKFYNEDVFTTYTLDENNEKLRIIDDIITSKKIPQNKIFTKEHYKVQPLTPIEEWLNSFRKSKFIFTDSFHGAVFSIIFNKQFIVYQNAQRGTSRMNSLLKDCGLENRLVTSWDDYKRVKNDVIDYNIVNQKLSILKDVSIKYLKNALAE